MLLSVDFEKTKIYLFYASYSRDEISWFAQTVNGILKAEHRERRGMTSIQNRLAWTHIKNGWITILEALLSVPVSNRIDVGI
jgi:hypothetical protein